LSLATTQQKLAGLLGYDERTMRYWIAGDRAIPSAVAILVRLLLKAKISFADVNEVRD
jgi:DNA-binding transcriptional regulator YdaS (Cro superfamily)